MATLKNVTCGGIKNAGSGVSLRFALKVIPASFDCRSGQALAGMTMPCAYLLFARMRLRAEPALNHAHCCSL